MNEDSLSAFIDGVRAKWSVDSADLLEHCRTALASLTLSPTAEPWLAELLSELPASRELHRDQAEGFMLLAHAEEKGLFRPPHDHGRSWVVYAVQSGELEVRTYRKVPDQDGKPYLVQSNLSVLRPGFAEAYLPGDIHDTRCLSDTALLFRFTAMDLRREDQVERRVTRFVERDGHWTVPGQ